MKNWLLLIFIFSLHTFTFSQEKRKTINGIVKLDSIVINDVHIINLNTDIGTISSDKGTFEIPVKLGDTLLFSHINLKKQKLIISNADMKFLNISIRMIENIALLKEFALEKPRSIFYVDPTIKIYNGPVVNAKTLELPYANTKKKPNTAIVKLSSGGILSIDNLINSLNGNKRRKKIVEKIANEDKRLEKIRKYFTDDFFITDLQIKKENINPFLNHCIQQGIISLFNKKENIKLTRILMKQSKSFPQKQKTDIKVAFKEN